MKSAIHRLPNPRCARALLIALLTVAGCGDSSNPVLPSAGGGPGSLAAALGSDGGTAIDTLLASDAQDVAARDAISDVISDTNSGTCDLLTQKGCLSSQACYSVDGVGQCQTTGTLAPLTTCYPNEGILGRCAGGLPCITTSTMGSMCLYLCAFAKPACGLGNVCILLEGSTTVGYCNPS
jgi:hypothetical protein